MVRSQSWGWIQTFPVRDWVEDTDDAEEWDSESDMKNAIQIKQMIHQNASFYQDNRSQHTKD